MAGLSRKQNHKRRSDIIIVLNSQTNVMNMNRINGFRLNIIAYIADDTFVRLLYKYAFNVCRTYELAVNIWNPPHALRDTPWTPSSGTRRQLVIYIKIIASRVFRRLWQMVHLLCDTKTHLH